MIKVTNLSKSFGKKQILNSINFEMKPGKVYGIVGKNGAGKTTIFNCLLGLESCDGEVQYSKGPLKNVTGFLPTDPYFLSFLTGKEYLQLMVNARGVQIESITSKNLFDLPLHRYAEHYSTGMKKKLALTGILLQKNEVYILDEPFNGVDIESNLIINELIKRLKEANKSILLSSHIFSTLQDNCDAIHYLEEGRLSEAYGKDQFVSIEDRLKGKQVDLSNFSF